MATWIMASAKQPAISKLSQQQTPNNYVHIPSVPPPSTTATPVNTIIIVSTRKRQSELPAPKQNILLFRKTHVDGISTDTKPSLHATCWIYLRLPRELDGVSWVQRFLPRTNPCPYGLSVHLKPNIDFKLLLDTACCLPTEESLEFLDMSRPIGTHQHPPSLLDLVDYVVSA